MGRQLYGLSRNIRPPPGDHRGAAPLVGAQRRWAAPATACRDQIDAVVVNLIDRITGRMRAAGHRSDLLLRLRFDDFGRAPVADAALGDVLDAADPAAARQLVASAAPVIAQRGLTLSASRCRRSIAAALSS